MLSSSHQAACKHRLGRGLISNVSCTPLPFGGFPAHKDALGTPRSPCSPPVVELLAAAPESTLEVEPCAILWPIHSLPCALTNSASRVLPTRMRQAWGSALELAGEHEESDPVCQE